MQLFSEQNHDEFTASAEAERKAKANARKIADEDEALRDKILKAGLAHVPELGWTKDALHAGVGDLGLPSVTAGMIGRADLDLIHFHMRVSNDALEDMMRDEVAAIRAREERLKIRSFLRGFTETRLRMNTPVIGRWAEAMGIMSQPPDFPESLQFDLKLFDSMWHYAGDKSTDGNWYTKRLSLGAIYKATELAMVQDKSEDFRETWEFLDRRFQDEMDIGSFLMNSRDAQKFIHGAVTTVENMLGLQKKK